MKPLALPPYRWAAPPPVDIGGFLNDYDPAAPPLEVEVLSPSATGGSPLTAAAGDAPLANAANAHMLFGDIFTLARVSYTTLAASERGVSDGHPIPGAENGGRLWEGPAYWGKPRTPVATPRLVLVALHYDQNEPSPFGPVAATPLDFSAVAADKNCSVYLTHVTYYNGPFAQQGGRALMTGIAPIRVSYQGPGVALLAADRVEVPGGTAGGDVLVVHAFAPPPAGTADPLCTTAYWRVQAEFAGDTPDFSNYDPAAHTQDNVWAAFPDRTSGPVAGPYSPSLGVTEHARLSVYVATARAAEDAAAVEAARPRFRRLRHVVATSGSLFGTQITHGTATVPLGPPVTAEALATATFGLVSDFGVVSYDGSPEGLVEAISAEAASFFS